MIYVHYEYLLPEHVENYDWQIVNKEFNLKKDAEEYVNNMDTFVKTNKGISYKFVDTFKRSILEDDDQRLIEE